MRFLCVLVDDSSRNIKVSFTFFRPFLAISGRFESPQPSHILIYNLTVSTKQFKAVPFSSMVPPLVFASIFALASTNPPAVQAYYGIAVFSNFFFAVLAEFFLR